MIVDRPPPRRAARAGAAIAASMLLAGLACRAAVGDAPPAVPPPLCIGQDRLPMPPGAAHAWLDEVDRGEVAAALLARFPMLQRDGLEARALLLWRQAEGDWRYAALVADPRGAGALCVAASFAGASIGGTDELARKYLPTAAPPAGPDRPLPARARTAPLR
ncbi:MAG: hypothetical protein JNM26_13430 [Ideonella sp.]|nr:hypothetical protein [Ideonella sp.]